MLNILLVFPFLSTVFRFKGSDQKMNLSKHVLQLKERLVTSSAPFLFFMILSINGDWEQRKNQVNFFMVSFKTCCLWSLLKFQKSFTCIGCFGLFTEIKKGYETVYEFSADFLHTFLMKMFLIHINWPSFTIWGVWPKGLRYYRMFPLQTPIGTQLLFGCPTANFEPLAKGQPLYLDVNHWIFYNFDATVTRRLVMTQPRYEVPVELSSKLFQSRD